MGMTLLLAPMEGLLDFVLRDVLTRVGAWTGASEFIRITGSLLPDKVFLRYVPELLNGSRTWPVPVRAQLLGQTRCAWPKTPRGSRPCSPKALT